MDIRGVRYFLAVCETGSFTEAARACGVSQPSVTTGLKRLEKWLGGRLFLRLRPVQLTPFGEELRPAFEAMRQAADTVADLTIAHTRRLDNAPSRDFTVVIGPEAPPRSRSASQGGA